MTEPRMYGIWTGNHLGRQEDPMRCIEEVYRPGVYEYIGHQCKRLRGHGPLGLYCQQHAKRYEVKP